MLRRWFACFICALAGHAGAVEPALIGVGDEWSYFPAVSEPPAAWRSPDFDDSAWRRGESGFGISRYGEQTFLFGMARGSGTVFFRKTFQVSDLEAIRSLTFRADWQGGFVAYLNGTEIVRQGLGAAGTPVAFTNVAEYRAAGWVVDFPLSRLADLLRSGTNVLAVQVHPSAFYDVVFVPELLANFTRGPFLQNVVSNRAEVLWRSPLAGSSAVEFGPTPELGRVAPRRAEPSYSFAALPDLLPGTAYHYRVVVGEGAGRMESPVYRFRTLPAEGPVTALLFGDSGSGSRSQFAVARQVAALQPDTDLVIQLGDIVYPWLHEAQVDTRCFSVYRRPMRSLPFFFTWGNHDLVLGTQPYLSAFRGPTNDVSALDHLEDRTRPESYYSFDAGAAHFAVLLWPFSSQYFMRPGCPQLRWLEADLAATTKRWKFLCLHHPVNTSSVHRFDDYNYNGVADRVEVQQALLPVAARHRVQAIFSGHDHAYERFQPLDGVHTVVSGGGGAGLYGLTERDTNSACFHSRWHLTRLEVCEDTLRVTALSHEGEPFDVLEFRDTPPELGDDDGDGLGETAELLLGTDPKRPDTDGDGLADGWEFLRGLDPVHGPAPLPLVGSTATDPALLEQFLAEPIPRQPAQLRALPLPDGRLRLRWLGAINRRVQVETASQPDGDYQALSVAEARPLAVDPQTLDLEAEGGARYFRVRLVPQ